MSTLRFLAAFLLSAFCFQLSAWAQPAPFNYPPAASGGSSVTNLGNGANSVLATNLSVYSSGTTNRPLRVYSTNGEAVWVDKDGIFYATNKLGVGTTSLEGTLDVYAASSTKLAVRSSGNFLSLTSGGALSAFQFDQAKNFGVLATATIGDLGLSQYSAITFGATRNTAFGDMAYNPTDNGYKIDIQAPGATGALRVASGLAFFGGSVQTTNLVATNITTSALSFGGGSTITGILSATATLDYDLTALTVEDLTITVTGAAVGNIVTLGVPAGSVTATIQFTAWVSAADTVTVRARTEAAGEDPASGTFRATIIKH